MCNPPRFDIHRRETASYRPTYMGIFIVVHAPRKDIITTKAETYK